MSAAATQAGRWASRFSSKAIGWNLPVFMRWSTMPEVLEFYDQAIQIKLSYEGPGGKRLGVLHTPDFFVIRTTSAGWEEWKTEEDLVQLAKNSPNRYLAGEGGQWRCPPGEVYAKDLGFYYRVRSSREINWVYQRNIQFLEDYLRSEMPIRPEAQEHVRTLVADRPAIRLSDLFQETQGTVTHDELFAMIALGPLETDLSSAPLTEPDKVHIRLTPLQAGIYHGVWDGHAESRCRAPFGNGPRSDSGGESAVKADSGLSGAGAAGRKRVDTDRSTLATTIPASRGSAWRWLSWTTTTFPVLREPEPQASGEDPGLDVGHHRD